MESSSNLLANTQNIRFSKSSDQDLFTASAGCERHAVEVGPLVQPATSRSQEIQDGGCKLLRSSFCEASESINSLNMHRLIGFGDARPEPLPRKGHNKSRKGCYSCKARRIKVCHRHFKRLHEEIYNPWIVSRE
jgi:hypothetical protein